MTLPQLTTFTGTGSRTVYVEPDGSFHTSEPPPTCEDCGCRHLRPLDWLCPICGEVVT